MHVALLTVLIITPAQPPAPTPADQPTMAPATDPYITAEDQACDGECGGVAEYGHRGCLKDWFGPMPQTCYAPRYGCYPGNNRHMRRYPAFHGTYYRSPYNYRQLFDYPWHAAPYEPMPYFLYRTDGGDEEILVPTPAQEGILPGPGQPLPPPPPPVGAASQARLPRYQEPRLLTN